MFEIGMARKFPSPAVTRTRNRLTDKSVTPSPVRPGKQRENGNDARLFAK